MSSAGMSLRKNQNIVKNKIRLESGPVTTILMMVSLLLILGLMYLSQVTKTSTFNYKISNLEQKQNQLQSSKDNLSIDAARLQSIAEAKKAAETAKLAQVKTVSFATAR
ncbi:MAG: hypothetical protein WCP56_01205 [Candidatus Saccharibacteria bacterium]|jgi:hypothetical protein|nr:hypothetical protein [Patescibacteria group bacterium]